MHAEERESWIRHGVDQRADQIAPVRLELQVRAAERHDARVATCPARRCQAVGPRARAEHGVGRLERAAGMLEANGSPVGVHPLHVGAACHCASGLGDVRRERAGHASEVGDSAVRRVQTGEPGCVRFEYTNLVAVEASQAQDAVPGTAPLELVERSKLAGFSGNHELATALVSDLSLLAEVVHRASAFHAQASL